jgi:phosphoribosylaminoimidazole (AIR) synthetase
MLKFGSFGAAFTAVVAANPAIAACPSAQVHAETARYVQLGAGGRADARAYVAQMSAPKTACQTAGGMVQVNLSFTVQADLAANVEAKPVKAPYFVVLMQAGKIVAKEVFPVTFAFGPAAPSVTLTETVDKIALPLRQSGKPDYEILVGFQLTPEQVRAAKN